MATLRFDVEADYSKVVKLREEITRLKSELRKFGADESAADQIAQLEARLAQAEQAATQFVDEAAKLEAVNLSKVASEAEKNTQELQGMNTALNETGNSLSRVERQSSQSGSGMESMRSKLRETREEIMRLTMELRGMSDEERNSATGKEMAARLDELKAKASQYADIQADVNREISAGANDVGKFAAASEGINLAVSATTALTGAMTMFGVSSEEAEQVQARIQSGLAISNGLMTAQNVLQKESNLMVQIGNIQRWAAVKAQAAEAAAKNAGTLATIKATIAQRAFNLVAKANPYVLLATALISVVGALALFARKAKDSTKEAEKLNESVKKIDFKGFGDAVGSAAGEAIAKFRELRKEWNEAKSDLEKQDVIQDFNSSFESMGVHVGNSSQAIDVFGAKAQDMEAYLWNVAVQAAVTAAKVEALKTAIANLASDKANKTVMYKRHESGETISKQLADQMGLSSSDYKVEYSANGKVNRVILNDSGKAKAEKYEINKSSRERAQRIADQTQAIKDLNDDRTYEEIGKSLHMDDNGFGNTLNRRKTTSRSSSRSRRNTNNADKAAKEQAENEKKANELLLKLRQENADARIELQEEGYDKERAANSNGYQKRLKEIQQQENEFMKLNKKSGAKTLGTGLTDDQTKALKDARTIALRDYWQEEAKLRENEQKEQDEAMRNYFEQYGTYLEQRAAVEQKFNEQIEKAKTEGDKLTLTTQRDEALKALDTEHLKKGLDWERLFGDVTNKTTEQLKTLKEDLRGMLSTENLGADDFARIVEQIERANDAIVANNNERNNLLFGWGKGNSYTRERERLTMNRDNAQEAYNKAQEAKDNAKTPKDKEDADKKATEAAQKLADAQDELTKHTNSVAAKFKGLKENIDKWNSMIQSMPDLMDSMGLGDTEAGNKVSQIADMANNAVGAYSDFMSGNYVGAAAKAFSAIGTLGDVLGVGGESDKTYAEDMEALTNANSILKESVDALAKKMDDSNLVDALELYSKQMANVAQTEENMQEQLARSGASYNSGKWGSGVGGSHSTNYKIDKGMSNADWAAISTAVGRRITQASELWSLSSEEMSHLQTDAVTQWIKLLDLADDGHQDLTAYLKEYITLYETANEVTDAIKEKFTQTTSDSLRDNFLSSLMDMDKSANDFADDFTEYLQQAVLNAKMSKLLDDDLEAFYNRWYELSQDGLTSMEAASLREEYAKLTEKGLELREQAKAITGYTGGSSSQSASRGEYEAMSEDTGTEISGRLTAIQEGQIRADVARSETQQSLVTMQGSISQLAMSVTGCYNIADDTRNILANSYIELQEINDNTGKTAKYLKTMQSDLDTIKRKL